MNYGILTLLPAVLVILTAIKTKRTTEALLMGVASSYLIICIIDRKNFITTITKSFFSVITDYDTMWLVIVCGLFGSLIALINAANGTHAIARFLGKICKSQKSTLLVAWILGIIIFVDDYMNILTISACTKNCLMKGKRREKHWHMLLIQQELLFVSYCRFLRGPYFLRVFFMNRRV